VVVDVVEELSLGVLSAGGVASVDAGGAGGAAAGAVVVVSLVVVVLDFEPESSQAAIPSEQVRTAARRASERRLVMKSSKHEGRYPAPTWGAWP
jgi:hypothetical protein